MCILPKDDLGTFSRPKKFKCLKSNVCVSINITTKRNVKVIDLQDGKSSPWKSLLSGVIRNLCAITSCCETPTKGALKKIGVEHRIFPFQAIYWFNIFIPSIDFNSSQEKKKKGTKQFSSQTHTHKMVNRMFAMVHESDFHQSHASDKIRCLPTIYNHCHSMAKSVDVVVVVEKRTSNNCLWWLKNKTECWHSNIVNQFISMLSVASFDRTDTTFIPYLFFNFEFPFSISSHPDIQHKNNNNLNKNHRNTFSRFSTHI